MLASRGQHERETYKPNDKRSHHESTKPMARAIMLQPQDHSELHESCLVLVCTPVLVWPTVNRLGSAAASTIFRVFRRGVRTAI